MAQAGNAGARRDAPARSRGAFRRAWRPWPCPTSAKRVDWAPLLAGVDAVVHLAGIAHVGLDLDPAIYDRVIRAATTELAAACAKASVRRLVFVSSVRAQSGASAPGVLRETDAPRPAESYGRAKLAAEAAVLVGRDAVYGPASGDGLWPRRRRQPREP